MDQKTGTRRTFAGKGHLTDVKLTDTVTAQKTAQSSPRHKFQRTRKPSYTGCIRKHGKI